MSRREWAAAVCLVALAAAVRVVASSRGADTVDTLYFARALERYSVAELRPYFPGFPVYVWAGRLAALAVPDPYLALHVVSGLASLLALAPIAGVAHDWRRAASGSPEDSRRSAWVAALLWAVLPAACIVGTETASEPLALLFGLVTLWGAGRTVDARPSFWPVATGVAAGLALGARLFHAVLVLPLLALAFASAPASARRRLVLGLAAGMAPWVAWHVVQDGWDWITHGHALVAQHVTRSEYTLWSERAPLQRLAVYLSSVHVHGLGGWAPGAPTAFARAAVTLGLLPLVVRGVLALRRAPPLVRRLALVWVLAFTGWVIAGQHVYFPRYTLPLAAAGVALAGVGAPRGRAGVALPLAVAAGAAGATLGLAREHHVEPTEFQLARHLGGLDPRQAAFVDVQPEPMVAVIVGAHAPRLRLVRVPAEELSSAARELARRGMVAYATMPGADDPQSWRLVAHFQRSWVFEPLSEQEVWLFGYEPSGSAAP